jgi:hypothetical protein
MLLVLFSSIHATTQKDAILPLFLVKLYLMFDHFFFKDCQYSWQVLYEINFMTILMIYLFGIINIDIF